MICFCLATPFCDRSICPSRQSWKNNKLRQISHPSKIQIHGCTAETPALCPALATTAAVTSLWHCPLRLPAVVSFTHSRAQNRQIHFPIFDQNMSLFHRNKAFSTLFGARFSVFLKIQPVAMHAQAHAQSAFNFLQAVFP